MAGQQQPQQQLNDDRPFEQATLRAVPPRSPPHWYPRGQQQSSLTNKRSSLQPCLPPMLLACRGPIPGIQFQHDRTQPRTCCALRFPLQGPRPAHLSAYQKALAAVAVAGAPGSPIPGSSPAAAPAEHRSRHRMACLWPWPRPTTSASSRRLSSRVRGSNGGAATAAGRQPRAFSSIWQAFSEAQMAAQHQHQDPVEQGAWEDRMPPSLPGSSVQPISQREICEQATLPASGTGAPSTFPSHRQQRTTC